MIKIWTDGSATSNGKLKGCGGWAYILRADGIEMEDADNMIDTTNNRMEMMAVLRALQQLWETKHIYSDKRVIFYCDSDLVVNTLRKNATFSQKKNLDIWAEINVVKDLLEKNGFDIEFMWIKAHDSSNPSEISKMNCMCDKIARKVRDRLKDELKFL